MELQAGSARIVVDVARGGRMMSLTLQGVELLADEGMFPMAPWAGRLAGGRFSFDGVEAAFPLNHPPNAAHGIARDHPWTETGPGTIEVELGDPWPFGGTVRQTFDLRPDHLTVTMALHAADRPMPGQLGWHPWFRRPVELELAADEIYELDDDLIPTGDLVPVPPGPWDDCFPKLTHGPQLRFPDGPLLELTSSSDHWVIFTQPDDAVCVEPQTGPPDQFHSDPVVVEPGAPLEAWFTMTW